MIEWPDSLVKDIARRRAVLIIGSGVSKHSIGTAGVRPPTWKAFLQNAISSCPDRVDLQSIEDALSANDLLHACEWLKKRYDQEWVPFLRQTFSTPRFVAAEVHEQINRLDSRIVFSLNFDDIYERYANSISSGSHIIKNFYDTDVAEFLRGSGRYIVKIHGNLSSAENLIFSQRDYSMARIKYSSFYQAFDAALLTHTFLFIGSGYSDPDVNLLLENQNFGFPSQSPHYFLGTSDISFDRRSSLRTNRNLKVLQYEPIDDLHSGLVEELKSLNTRVEAEVFEIKNNVSW